MACARQEEAASRLARRKSLPTSQGLRLTASLAADAVGDQQPGSGAAEGAHSPAAAANRLQQRAQSVTRQAKLVDRHRNMMSALRTANKPVNPGS